MVALRVWKRLLWKEFREGWLFVCLSVLLPAVTIPAAAAKLPASLDPSWVGVQRFVSINMLISMIATIGVLSVAVWGARNRPQSRSFADNLPIDTRTTWVSTFLAPLIVAASVGAVTGVCVSSTIRWTHMPLLSLVWAGLYAGCFASAYLVTSAGNTWLGLVAGAAFALAFTGNLIPDHWQTWREQSKEFLSAASFCAAVASGALAGNVMLGLYRRNAGLLKPRAIALGLAVLIPVGFSVVDAMISPAEPDENVGDVTDFIPSVSLTQMLSTYRAKSDMMKVEFRDTRLDLKINRNFPYPTRALGFTSATHVYLMQQPERASTVSILIWNPVANTVRTVASIPAGRHALTRSSLSWISAAPMLAGLNRGGFVSPSGRYVVAVLPSAGGAGQDLWVTDLREGSSKLILVNRFFGAREAAWPVGRAVISGYGNAVEVNLAAKSARIIEIPASDGS